jgi:anaerobic sulfite reductase subunit C
MKWNQEAEATISRVPFFVRPRVRKRVEEEAARFGAAEVRPEHVHACQRRFLNQMEDEVQGYRVETCFGSSGCSNRAVDYKDFPRKIEERLVRRNLKSFLRERVRGALKMHHEFRVSISDCPNACSRPQIADLGLIGAARPAISDEECVRCGACVDACREEAVLLCGKWPVINWRRCVSCGQCLSVCPTRTLRDEKRGFRLQVGGKLGRHPSLARELPGILTEDEALRTLERCLDHYQQHCRAGEKLGEILERTGGEGIEKIGFLT